MEKILFRSSSAGDLLTEPKLKSDKDLGILSETAKSLVKKVWLYKQFGYTEDVLTDEMLKGILCEQESMGLVQKVLKGEFRVAFKKNLSNDYITGTPDIVLQKEDYVEDIKSSFNLRTFVDAEPNKLYETQAQCYMELTGKKHFRLIYCLVKTPESIITSQKTKWFYKFNCDSENEDYINVAMQIDHNNNLIDKLPLERRIKIFEFHHDKEYIARLYDKIDKAREFYKTLDLPNANTKSR